MTGLDTNVVVRLIVRDDPNQLRRAVALVQAGPCWISTTVLLETAWVLRAAYGYDSAKIVEAFSVLLSMQSVTVQAPTTAARALDWHDEGMDFADALHLASASGQRRFATFDKHLRRSSARLQTLPPAVEP